VTGNALAGIVNIVLYLASLTILAQVLLSWVLHGRLIDPSSSLFPVLVRVYDTLREITEPILSPLRRFAMIGMMDFSPVVALILIQVIRELVVGLLSRGF
jgi:uncharacterized protein YggT (Ycf19 family)